MDRFVRERTALVEPPLVPEMRLHLATDAIAVWEASEAAAGESGLPPPFWAFCWPGGQAVARWLLDNPEVVAGRTVLDVGSGCGIASLAALRAGAARAVANDIDPFAAAVLALNAAANDLSPEVLRADLLAGAPLGFEPDVILAGDVCYERGMAERLVVLLRRWTSEGRLVLLGDPGRNYAPSQGLELLASYPVKVPLDLEDREVRETAVWRMIAPPAAAG